jgi:hypothetical protein
MNTTKHCKGCRDNFYNGNNDLNVKRCWSLDSAKLVKRLLIPVDLRPPYKHIKPERVLDCYRPNRTASVEPSAIGADGYWRSMAFGRPASKSGDAL